MFDIQEELKKLPELPGVYIMKDAAGTIIYVGKAIILKNRVRQYFQKSSNHTPKVLAMVEKIASFEYIVTENEVEALILECNLIKHHKPRYNILLKDDKAYPYIRITMNEAYPRIMLARKIENNGSKYFGPYISNYTVNLTIEILNKIFQLKTCTRELPKEIGKERPCLNYHLGRCLAPCQGYVNAEEYRSLMNDICSFLSGKDTDIIKRLEKQMQREAENLNFELAAEIRDRIQYIVSLTEKQKVDIGSMEDMDIAALAKNNEDTCVQVFFIRGGKTLGRDHFILEGTGSEPDEEIMSSFIKQFYENAAFYPPVILVPVELKDAEIIEKWLSERKGQKVYIKIPQRGEKLSLVKMVEANAKISLNNYSGKGIDEKNLVLLEKLTDLTGLEKMPLRIEAYDVSNTGKQENVASMTVFQNGKPAKKEYRRFKIKMEEWQGDIPSMKEVISRRLKHTEMSNPDLILVDGGIGHVHAVMETIENSERNDLKNIPVFGMVKDDRHRTRGLIDNNSNEIPLKQDIDVFRFITSIQDETHRFAIEYNKKLRQKRYTLSVLEDIEGVGKARKKELLKHFGSIGRIKDASLKELTEVRGITEKIAGNIKRHFSKGE